MLHAGGAKIGIESTTSPIRNAPERHSHCLPSLPAEGRSVRDKPKRLPFGRTTWGRGFASESSECHSRSRKSQLYAPRPCRSPK